MERAIDAALTAGYRHIDTAFVYMNEAAIGRSLKKWFDSGKIQREELFIVTKVNNELKKSMKVNFYCTLFGYVGLPYCL